MEHSFWW